MIWWQPNQYVFFSYNKLTIVTFHFNSISSNEKKEKISITVGRLFSITNQDSIQKSCHHNDDNDDEKNMCDVPTPTHIYNENFFGFYANVYMVFFDIYIFFSFIVS